MVNIPTGELDKYMRSDTYCWNCGIGYIYVSLEMIRCPNCSAPYKKPEFKIPYQIVMRGKLEDYVATTITDNQIRQMYTAIIDKRRAEIISKLREWRLSEGVVLPNDDMRLDSSYTLVDESGEEYFELAPTSRSHTQEDFDEAAIVLRQYLNYINP